MVLTLTDLYDLKDGRRDPVVVGALPEDIRIVLALPIGNVYLSKKSFLHIIEKHSPSYFDLLLSPIMIRNGLLLREKVKKNIIITTYL